MEPRVEQIPEPVPEPLPQEPSAGDDLFMDVAPGPVEPAPEPDLPVEQAEPSSAGNACGAGEAGEPAGISSASRLVEPGLIVSFLN